MADADALDLSAHIDLEAMPCCPLCDNAIDEWHLVHLIFAHGCKALAHTHCVEGIEPLPTPKRGKKAKI